MGLFWSKKKKKLKSLDSVFVAFISCKLSSTLAFCAVVVRSGLTRDDFVKQVESLESHVFLFEGARPSYRQWSMGTLWGALEGLLEGFDFIACAFGILFRTRGKSILRPVWALSNDRTLVI